MKTVTQHTRPTGVCAHCSAELQGRAESADALHEHDGDRWLWWEYTETWLCLCKGRTTFNWAEA